MTAAPVLVPKRCAIYTRKSTTSGLDKDFTSLDAQREACELFVRSQAHAGWVALGDHYDDGGFYVEHAIMLRSALITIGTQREARDRST